MRINIEQKYLIVYNKQDNIDFSKFNTKSHKRFGKTVLELVNDGNIIINLYFIKDTSVNESLRGDRYTHVYFTENAKVKKEYIDNILEPILTDTINNFNISDLKVLDIKDYYNI